MKTLRTFLALTLMVCSLPVAAFATTPVASSFSTTVAANRQNAVQLQGSDAEGTALVYATTSTPSHGTLSGLNTATGAVVYTPVADYVGADSFTYTVTSGGETSAAGTVTLTVTNAKTRIIDTVTDASGAPRAGKVTFILTQPTTSPGGLTPKGSSVSASLNSLGQFDISVYPSRSMSPAAYYQVHFVDNNAGQILLGIYDIPLSTATINLSPYKVLDTNLAAQYTFASAASVSSLSTAVATATTTMLLGTSPTNNALQKYNSTAGKFANSVITDTGTTVSVAANTTVTGNVTTSGSVTANNLNLTTLARSMLSKGLIDYSPDYISGFTNFYDLRKEDLTEGDKIASLTDLSGNGRHAVQATESLQPTYHATESYTENPGSYMQAAGTTEYLTAPIPASSTRAFFVTVRNQGTFPAGGYVLNYDANNHLAQLGNRWFGYRVSGSQGTTAAGYSLEWSVLCWRQNSPTSISFFVDGVLVETYTAHTSALASATSIKIGPGMGRIKQVAVRDLGRPLTDAEVLEDSTGLRSYNGWKYKFKWYDSTVGGYAPTLASHALVGYKEGFKGKRPLVILNHQAGQTERVFMDNTQQRAVLTALLDAGYIVAISRLWTVTAGENTWGNDAAIDANVEMYNEVVSEFPVDTTKVAMLGMSMGGLPTMIAFADGRIPLDGAACYDCVLDLAHTYAQPAFTAPINTAFNIPGGGNYATQTSGHDPRLLGTTPFSSKRFIFFRNSGDLTINPTENTGDFAAQIAGVATEATVTTGSGIHLDGMDATTTALLAFFARCFS